jgi:hypothetical protein
VWQRVFPAVIRLAVAPEQATRVLFQKLLQQLAHWFAHHKAKTEETSLLLSALSDGIASEVRLNT